MRFFFIKNFNKITISIILSSFFLTIFFADRYLKRFDNYDTYHKDNHPMIKSAVKNHWYEASKILEDIKSGKSFFKSGYNQEDEFLPQKILAFYYLIIDEELYEKKLIKIDNGKLSYLITRNLFYFLLIFIFFFRFKEFFPKEVLIAIIAYLCFFPDIFQYHLSFWNESYSFIFQIILIFFLINFSFSLKKNFYFGISAASLFLVGQEYLFYLVIFLFYYLFIKIYYKKKIFKPLVSFTFGYLIIIFFAFWINDYKTESKSINVYGLKSALYLYIVPEIIAKKNEISIKESQLLMKNEAILWAEKNNIKKLKPNDLFIIDRNDPLEFNKYNNYLLRYSLEKIFFNLHEVIFMHLKSSMHTIVLNPFFIKNFHEFKSFEEQLKSKNHIKQIKYRIIFSIIFYIVLIFGFYKSLRFYRPEFIFVISLLVLYNVIVLGWLGSSRYFVPSLIYLSLFFGPIFKWKNQSLTY